MTAALRVGLFGGAFDPPHRAHRALLQAAQAQLGLDQVRVIPTGQAWHKARALSAAEHRVAMARLAFEALEKVQIDLRETLRPGPSYTIDTLRELRGELPSARLFLLIGQDQARDLPGWQQWEQVLELATVCYARRADAPDSPPAELPALLRERLVALALPPITLSATDIRERVGRGEAVDALVGEPVARYIALHRLYKNT